MSNESEEEISKRALVLRILDVFGELFALNILFVIFSLPLFTIGASLTALYSMVFKVQESRSSNLLEGFIAAFKKNFKQGTIILLMILFWGVVLYAQYVLVINTAGIIGNIYLVILFITGAIGFLTISFIFPVLARFNNPVKTAVKNSFLIAISNLWQSVKITCLWFGTIAISFMYPVIFMYSWFLWLLIAFALITFLSVKIALKVFSNFTGM